MSLSGRVLELRDRTEVFFFAAADPRSYSGIQVGLGVAVLSILIDLFPLRASLLQKDGLVGGAITVYAPDPLNFLHWGGGMIPVDAAFAVGACGALMLILGVLPRVGAVLSYLWITSYSGTNIFAACGYDALTRLTAFVLIFSPSVDSWGIGARFRRSRVSPQSAPPIYGLRILQWQLFLVYFCTIWLKIPDTDWRNGEMLTYFWMSGFSRFPNPIVAQLRPLNALMTWGSLALEASLPFLLWTKRLRLIGVSLGLLMHLGIAVTTHLALFSVAIIPLYFAFLGTDDFERLQALGQRSRQLLGAFFQNDRPQ